MLRVCFNKLLHACLLTRISANYADAQFWVFVIACVLLMDWSVVEINSVFTDVVQKLKRGTFFWDILYGMIRWRSVCVLLIIIACDKNQLNARFCKFFVCSRWYICLMRCLLFVKMAMPLCSRCSGIFCSVWFENVLLDAVDVKEFVNIFVSVRFQHFISFVNLHEIPSTFA